MVSYLEANADKTGRGVLILVVVDDGLVLPVDCFVGRIYPMS